MISKNKIKYLISLQKKKNREDENLYVIEGDKLVREFLAAGIPVKAVYAKQEFISSLSANMKNSAEEIETVTFEDLKQISSLKTPHNALALVPVPQNKFDMASVLSGLCVALDFVQDPGNLGTIIRAAAWFGIKNIVCSENCVDIYNPKVIQSCMGAILHVNVQYTDLTKFLIEADRKKIPVYGTLLDGESIYSHPLSEKGIIVLGNESRGISDDLTRFITEKIMIPKFSSAKFGIDSLNVSMAASVVFSEFARKNSSAKTDS
jgi:TrmH family RNA methyltransferase